MFMDAETLTITSPDRRHPASSSLMVAFWRVSYSGRAFPVVNVLLCIFLCFVACEPLSVLGAPEQVQRNDPCGPLKENYGSALPNVILSDFNGGYIPDNSKVLTAYGNVCANSELFCFPSTLPGFSSERYNYVDVTSLEDSFNDRLLVEVGAGQFSECASNSSWSLDHGMSILVNGRTVMCSLNSGKSINELSYIGGNSSTNHQNGISSCRGPLLNRNGAIFSIEEDVEMITSGPDVEISPPILDWGEKYLYVPSLAFVTVTNNWNDSILHVYQPISMDTQFFPCNFTETILGPGEAFSICFVFLPKSLGLSSAHLILQTSSGGFLVQAKGYAVDSPYGFQSLLGLNVSSGGSWRKNVTLFNPFDESIRVEEISMWVSMGKSACQIEATCSLQSLSDADDLGVIIKDWFLVRTSPFESSSQMALRLHRNWEVSPQSSENIVELDFSFSAVGKIVGAFCMQLTRLSQQMSDIIMVPIEAEVDISPWKNNETRLVTVSLESWTTSGGGGGGGFVLISLRNSGQSVLTIPKINEIGSSGLFHIKYMEGLLLFPGTVTQVAVVTCAHQFDEVRKFTREMSEVDKNCKLLVQMNDSTSRIEILCCDIMHLCARGEDRFGDSEHQSSNVGSGDGRTVSVDRLTSTLKTAESDELVLRNWKSQATDTGSSVINDNEVFFPIVPVGTHQSKWITVHNPTRHPVIMQLLLNSGEIIDNCRENVDGLVELISSGKSVMSKSAVQIRDGFSLAENAQTEALVRPFDKASLGPLIFHPSKRCEWRSSVLVRNNLSGVEWLPMRGLGGSRALAISEGAKPTREIEFELESTDSFDVLNPDWTSSHPCSRPLVKVLSIRNSGDLTLEVRRIRVSGTDCRLDGFAVHNCSHFALQPGESTKLTISYESKFLTPLVCRELELTLASGIFVLPLKAKIPLKIIGECKRSFFWSRAEKIFAAVLVAAPCVFFVFCCFYPQVLAIGVPYCFCKRGESIPAMTHKVVKSSKVQCGKKNSKFAASTKAKHLPNLVIDEKALLLGSESEVGSEEHGMRVQHVEMPSRVDNTEKPMFTTEMQTEGEKSSLNSIQAKNCIAEEQSLPGNLSIHIGKEKGRRRRKRKGTGSGLSALVEVSSSHSGNSTPSSPLSPISSTTLTPQRAWPKPNDVEQCLEPGNPLSQWLKSQTPEPLKSPDLPPPVTLKQPMPPTPLERPKTANKPVLLPSATFPSSSRSLASTVTIAPHARAPGSRLCGNRATKAEETAKKAEVNDFTYDIWGDHFSAINLMGRRGSRDDSSRIPGVVNTDDSDSSFFARGPQALLTKHQREPLSSRQVGNNGK